MSTTASHTYQQQEEAILQAAARCIEESSLLDFTMAAISKAVGLSMGSIYKHIQSKEDVLLALGHRSRLHFAALARQVVALPLPIAARLVGIQLVDAEHASPFSFGAELTTLLANEALLRRGSRGWLDQYLAADAAVEQLFYDQLARAWDDGEIGGHAERKETLCDAINTATWSLCVGYLQVVRQRGVRALAATRTTRLEVDSTIIRALQRLLNTYEWRTPLTDEWIARTGEALEQIGLRTRNARRGEPA
jgi:AcrR family transcriptional regulator